MKSPAILAVTLLSLAACGEPTRPPAVAADRAEAEHGSGSAYRVIDLGNLGGSRTFALHVNNRGQVSGNAGLPNGDPHAFIWDAKHGMVDLGTLGGSFSIANGMNDHGVVVGHSGDASNTRRAFVWTAEDGMRDIGTLGGPSATASGITEDGEVVGYSSLVAGGKSHGFTWTKRHGMRDVGTLNGGSTELRAISESGEFGAGSARPFAGGPNHAVIWSPRAGYTDIETLGHRLSFAVGVNDHGQVIGNALTAALGQHCFIWEASSGMIDLVPLDGPDGYASVGGLNEHGVVVGASSTPDDIRGFIWTEHRGMRRLDGLPGEVFGHADGINDDGWIVGASEPGDEMIHAILWMPKDE